MLLEKYFLGKQDFFWLELRIEMVNMSGLFDSKISSFEKKNIKAESASIWSLFWEPIWTCCYGTLLKEILLRSCSSVVSCFAKGSQVWLKGLTWVLLGHTGRQTEFNIFSLREQLKLKQVVDLPTQEALFESKF